MGFVVYSKVPLTYFLLLVFIVYAKQYLILCKLYIYSFILQSYDLIHMYWNMPDYFLGKLTYTHITFNTLAMKLVGGGRRGKGTLPFTHSFINKINNK